MDSRLSGHISALDGVRGLAILAVLVFHTARPEPVGTIEQLVQMVLGFGWAGVDLFFVLSGFLITGILLDARGSSHYYRAFYIRRALRIFPLYLAFCSVLFFVLPVVADLPAKAALADAAPWYWTYTMNIRIAAAESWGASVMGTAMFWSLCVEEQFYLVWPWVVARLNAVRLLWLCGTMVVLALALRVALVLGTDNAMAAYVLLPARMDALAVGAGIATIVRLPGGLDRIARIAPAVFLGAASLIVMIVGATAYTGWDHPMMATVGFSATAMASGAMLVLILDARRARWLVRVLSRRELRFFGTYSYGMYLLGGVSAAIIAQSPLHDLAVTRIGGTTLPGLVSAIVLDLALVSVLALLSWFVLERPVLALKSRVPYAPRQLTSESSGISAVPGLPAC